MGEWGVASKMLKKLQVASDKMIPTAVKILSDEVIKTYHVTLEETPQYSGYLVSNLRILINGKGAQTAPDLLDAHMNYRSLGELEIKQKGDDYAMGIASSYNRGAHGNNLHGLALTDTIGIAYKATYWEMAEDGVKLRDVNKPGRALETGLARMTRVYVLDRLMPSVGSETI